MNQLTNNTEAIAKKIPLAPQVLYKFHSSQKIVDAIIEFNTKINWSKVPRRDGQLQKEGKTFIYSSSSKKNIIELEQTHNWLNQCLNHVVSNLGWKDGTIEGFRVTQTWLNISEYREFHHPHIHPCSLLSGILYVTEPSTTNFYIPSIYSLPRVLSADKRTTNLMTTVKCRKGDLIIFPSYILHGVEENKGHNPRITLAFNSWFSGNYGTKNTLKYIPTQ